MLTTNRSTFAFKLKKSLQSPNRVLPYLHRKIRNHSLSKRTKNHLEFYKLIVDKNALVNPNEAVGTASNEDWMKMGKYQFEYLKKYHLAPEHKFLDFGCGNLRAGIHLIPYLNTGNYVGLDISTNILITALHNIEKYNLQQKMPYLYLVNEMDFSFLPEKYFDVIQAHSVFSHSTLETIDNCLKNIKVVMKDDGFFDFTFFETETEGVFLNEDFYYTMKTVSKIIEKNGYKYDVMKDWEHLQTKVRIRKSL